MPEDGWLGYTCPGCHAVYVTAEECNACQCDWRVHQEF